MTRQLEEAMDACDAGKIIKSEYDALANRLQDKAMRLNELGIMSDAAYCRFEDVSHNDTEAQSALEECREALEKEAIAYLAQNSQNSPNPYERAFYRKRL